MPGERDISWGRAVTWGAYLACSWTWCIGMFLPLLLVRDLGAWGWWAFAIPNVVGAAAMGWVLRSSVAASRVRAEHDGAARAFSVVTIAFHAYFLGWVGGSLLPAEVVPPTLLAAGLLAGATIWLRERVRWVALVLWLFSAAVLMVVLLARPGAVAAELSRVGELASVEVLWLAPVCVFGFALCPYLDLTFLRARRVCDGRTGAAAFTIGFGLMFASMIVLTLGYGGMLDGEVLSLGLVDRPLWAGLATVHIALQAAFTVGVHLVELATPRGRRVMAGAAAMSAGGGRESAAGPVGGVAVVDRAEPGAMGALVLLVACVVSAGLGVAARGWPEFAGLLAGEVGYRVFMSAYGLAFPAYVWVCVVPRRSPVARPRLLAAWAAGVLVASPLFAAGFLWRESVWLAPGLVVALSARWWVGGRARG